MFLMGQTRPLFRLLSVFSNKHYKFLQQIHVKNVHPVYGAGIRTHDWVVWGLQLLENLMQIPFNNIAHNAT